MNRDELENEILALLDCELDQERIHALEAEILIHPGGLELYRELSRLHTVLGVTASARGKVGNWNVVPIDRINAMQRRRWVKLSLVAAMVTLLCAAAALWMGISKNRLPRHAFGVSPGAVYTLTHPEDHISDGSATLVRGSRVVLESGTLECWFEQGVRGVIKAPCDLTVTDDHVVTMAEGTGWFQVAKGAEGFTVITPELVVVDLGTEFAILSDPRKNDEVHVFSGSVRVSSRAPLRETTELPAGKAIYSDAAGRLKPNSENRRPLFASLSQTKHRTQPTNMKRKIAIMSAITAASFAEGATTLAPSSYARIDFNQSTEVYTVVTSSSSQFLASDLSSANNSSISTFNFSLGANLAEVAAATSITFSITPTAKYGTATGIRLVAFTTDDNSLEGSDFNAPGTIVAFIPDADITVDQPLVFDITSFAKADALVGSGYSSYRLEREVNTNNNDTFPDGYAFGPIGIENAATITIIPEPSSALLGSLTVIGLLLRRRR